MVIVLWIVGLAVAWRAGFAVCEGLSGLSMWVMGGTEWREAERREREAERRERE